MLATEPETIYRTPADSSGRVIEIQDVVGPGDLNNESVKLRRVGAGDLRLYAGADGGVDEAFVGQGHDDDENG